MITTGRKMLLGRLAEACEPRRPSPSRSRPDCGVSVDEDVHSRRSAPTGPFMATRRRGQPQKYRRPAVQSTAGPRKRLRPRTRAGQLQVRVLCAGHQSATRRLTSTIVPIAVTGFHRGPAWRHDPRRAAAHTCRRPHSSPPRRPCRPDGTGCDPTAAAKEWLVPALSYSTAGREAQDCLTCPQGRGLSASNLGSKEGFEQAVTHSPALRHDHPPHCEGRVRPGARPGRARLPAAGPCHTGPGCGSRGPTGPRVRAVRMAATPACPRGPAAGRCCRCASLPPTPAVVVFPWR